jgi:ketosteroid isomerase-like protein
MAVDRAHVDSWVAGYEAAWRTAGTDALARLFTPQASYSMSPWREPAVGLDALAELWESERDGPDEPFTLEREVVAVDGDTAVVRLAVDYGRNTGGRWRDLWVLRFAPDGRCEAFEEWPFAPGQRDGH